MMIVTKGELHQRSTLRYTMMSIIIISVIVLSVVTSNWTGVILLVFLTGGYLFYSTFATERLTLSTDSDGIQVGNIRRKRSHYIGYAVEVDTTTSLIRNIILIHHNGHQIHTVLLDENDHEIMESILLSIDEQLPLLEGFNQTPIEILMRKFKI